MAQETGNIYQGTGKLLTFTYSGSRRALNVFDNVLVRLTAGGKVIASYCWVTSPELETDGFETDGLDMSLVDQNIIKVNLGAAKTKNAPTTDLKVDVKLVYEANENQSEEFSLTALRIIPHSLAKY